MPLGVVSEFSFPFFGFPLEARGAEPLLPVNGSDSDPDSDPDSDWDSDSESQATQDKPGTTEDRIAEAHDARARRARARRLHTRCHQEPDRISPCRRPREVATNKHKQQWTKCAECEEEA